MNILITTPIAEGTIGGPASVAAHLTQEFTAMGDTVRMVGPSQFELRIPVFIRQGILFFRFMIPVMQSDTVIMLDPLSTGLPAILLAKIFHKPTIIRIGGDFLWESYVERTQEPILLSEFYNIQRSYVLREKLIFRITKFTLSFASSVVFTTDWQRSIWKRPYELHEKQTIVIENALPVCMHEPSMGNVLLASGRHTRIKNVELLNKVWVRIQHDYPSIRLVTEQLPAKEYKKLLAECRAVIQPSISDVSPNTILEAIACRKPFIATHDTGIREQYPEAGIYIDTRDESSLENALRTILTKLDATVHTSYPSNTWADVVKKYRDLLVGVSAGSKTL